MISTAIFGFLGVMTLGNYHNVTKVNEIVNKAKEITKKSSSGYYYYLWKPSTNAPLKIGYDSRDFMTKEHIIEAPQIKIINNKYHQIKYSPIFQHTQITYDSSNLYFTTNLLSILHEKYSVEVNRVIVNDNYVVFRGVPISTCVYTVVGYYNGYEFVKNDRLVIEKDMSIEDIIEQSNRDVTHASILCTGTLITGILCGLYEYYYK